MIKKYSEHVQTQLNLINESIDAKQNIVLDVYADLALETAKNLDPQVNDNPYLGKTFLLKDNIHVKGHVTTSGSKIMHDFIAPFNATIVDNINKHQAIILGKVNLDELGHAGTGTFSAFGVVSHPLNHNKITGGSSSGSVAAIKLNLCDIAVGTDTGDSIRRPASLLGVVGFKPSYGLVSRYGVTAYASSLDHVGVIAQDVYMTAIGTDIIKGHDPKDCTTLQDNNCFVKSLNLTSQKYKLVIFDDVNNGMNIEVKTLFNNFINDLQQSHEIIHLNFGMDLLNILTPLYSCVSYREGFSNWSNVNGIMFGGKNLDYCNYQDLMYQTRNNFGEEVKLRYLINTLFIDDKHFEEVYERSNKIRRIIVNKINTILNDCDAVILPGASSFAFDLDKTLNRQSQTNFCDDALSLANFAGLPSITIPLTNPNNANAFGICLNGKYHDDYHLVNIAYNLEHYIKQKGYYDK